MSFKSIFSFFANPLNSSNAHAVVARERETGINRAFALPVAFAARVHFLVAPSAHRVSIDPCKLGRRNLIVTLMGQRLKPTAKTVARAAVRIAYAGGPLTPTGYAIVTGAVAIVGLVAMTRDHATSL